MKSATEPHFTNQKRGPCEIGRKGVREGQKERGKKELGMGGRREAVMEVNEKCN